MTWQVLKFPKHIFLLCPSAEQKGTKQPQYTWKGGMKIIAGSCWSCRRGPARPAQHGLRCPPPSSAALLAALGELSPASFIYLCLRSVIYLFAAGRAGGGRGLGGVYVIAVYTAFPRSYCLGLCFLFPSRVLISWSCWLAGRRVSGLNAERSLPGGI